MMSTQGMLDGFDPPATRSAEIARVLVDVDLAHMDRPLDYVVPDALVDEAVVGSLVRVRLSGGRVDGWIVERTRREVSDSVGRLESVVSATPVVTPALYEASKRIALRFLATTSQVLSLAVPPRHARAENRLKAVSKGSVHNVYKFFRHFAALSNFKIVLILPSFRLSGYNKIKALSQKCLARGANARAHARRALQKAKRI